MAGLSDETRNEGKRKASVSSPGNHFLDLPIKRRRPREIGSPSLTSNILTPPHPGHDSYREDGDHGLDGPLCTPRQKIGKAKEWSLFVGNIPLKATKKQLLDFLNHHIMKRGLNVEPGSPIVFCHICKNSNPAYDGMKCGFLDLRGEMEMLNILKLNQSLLMGERLLIKRKGTDRKPLHTNQIKPQENGQSKKDLKEHRRVEEATKKRPIESPVRDKNDNSRPVARQRKKPDPEKSVDSVQQTDMTSQQNAKGAAPQPLVATPEAELLKMARESEQRTLEEIRNLQERYEKAVTSYCEESREHRRVSAQVCGLLAQNRELTEEKEAPELKIRTRDAKIVELEKNLAEEVDRKARVERSYMAEKEKTSRATEVWQRRLASEEEKSKRVTKECQERLISKEKHRSIVKEWQKRLAVEEEKSSTATEDLRATQKQWIREVRDLKEQLSRRKDIATKTIPVKDEEFWDV